MSYSFLINEQNWRSRLEPYLTQPIAVYKEALTNNHYEGDVKGKATLNIISIGELTYTDYTGADITFQDLTESEQTFPVDQAKYTAFKVDDPNQTTTEVNLVDQGSKKLAYQIGRMYDDYLAGLYTQIVTNVYGAGGSTAWSQGGYSGTGPVSVGFDNTANQVLPSTALYAMRQIALQNNAMIDAPNIVIPVWLESMIRQELGLRIGSLGDRIKMSGSISGAEAKDLSGFAGWNSIWVSNLVPNTNGGAYRVMGGNPDVAITFASHLEKIETLRIQAKFATGIKALAVFGAKVPFEGHMALGTFDIGSYLTNPRSY